MLHFVDSLLSNFHKRSPKIAVKWKTPYPVHIHAYSCNGSYDNLHAFPYSCIVIDVSVTLMNSVASSRWISREFL